MVLVAALVIASTLAGVAAERRHGPRADALSRRITWAILYLLLPPIVFFNLARAELTARVGAGIGFALLALLVACVLAWLVGSRVLRLERARLGAVLTVVVLANTGYLGLPFAAATLGFASLDDAVLYDLIVGGTAFLIGAFAVGAAFGTVAEHPRGRVVAFFSRNVPLAAAVAALVAPDALAPDLLVDASRILIIAIAPLGFFATGVALGHERAFRLTRPVALALTARLLVAPAVLLALSALVFRMPDAYLVQAAMACGLNNLVVADAYGLDRGTVAAAILWSTGIVLTAGLAATLAS